VPRHPAAAASRPTASIAPHHFTARTPGLVLLSLVAQAGPLAGQGQRDTVALEEIVVTADRIPTPLAKSIAATTVITGEALQAQGIHFVEDALRQVPGAAVVPTGSYGGVSSLFLRGGESDFVKVLVDGVPVNQSGGAYNFGTLTTDNIERIEIVRGPVSVLYGSDAVAGVVQIFTRAGGRGFRAHAMGRAGTYGTRAGEVGASGARGPVALSASLSRLTTDGTYRFNSNYQSTDGSGAITLRPDSRSEITFTARAGDNVLHYPTDFAGVPVDSNQRNLQNSAGFGLELGRRFTEGLDVRLFAASYREEDGSDNRPDSPGDNTGVYASRSRGRALRRQVDASGIFRLGSRLRISAGAQAEFEDLIEASRSEFDFGGGPGVSLDAFSATRRNVGFYGQGVADLGPRALVNLGARVDDNQKFGTHATFRAGAVYRLTGGLRARASVGTGFKEPSLRENYARTAFEVGNPALDPEESRSWEAGLEQSLLLGRATVAVNYFDQRFRNLIQYDGNAQPGEPNYQNVARATSRGIEVIGDFRPAPSVTVTASYTWLETRVDDAGFSSGTGDVFVEGKPLIRRPRHSARLDARGRVADRLSLAAGISYVGRRDDVDFRPFPSIRTRLPAYLTVDADVSFDLLRRSRGRPGLAATLRAENLFDRSYQTVVGFDGRGRALFAGARVGL
jgi:vitamin B12 transporter